MRRKERERVAAALESAAPDLMRFLVRRTSSADEAADLFGEVSLVAWRRRSDAPAAPEEIRLWLFGVARNALLNHWRASRRAAQFTAELKAEALMQPPEADPAARIADIDFVQRLLLTLDVDTAELIRLVHWDRLSVADAATVLGIPSSTARSRYATAKETLRRQIQETSPP